MGGGEGCDGDGSRDEAACVPGLGLGVGLAWVLVKLHVFPTQSPS